MGKSSVSLQRVGKYMSTMVVDLIPFVNHSKKKRKEKEKKKKKKRKRKRKKKEKEKEKKKKYIIKRQHIDENKE